ncbi:hypothetical protein AWI85_05945 [Listeria monocytogenes]|uniref:hypothetical protein n=1 Tax=Listeria monocytogenes TaxID=1639 RepID=UPI0007759158|nr:hypothetical protein [Listeria monocytogenes]EAD0080286.1 hypothetical protein [Listeria monocytogenes]EAF8771737.1 hypothetical protein [Listeria monocytogenes]KXS79254.1 hypothetical protein AWI86_05235 [Listeria monocytogenes]KXS81542.1 hypothetical protein AWI85_05945 [Listeria monocytogenes]KXX12486.1 hypothetical protein AWI84_06165 [Listeria monocytogenes]
MIFDEIKKGMSDAAQVINSNFLKIASATDDSGWKDMSLKVNFSDSNGDAVPQYRKIGTKVEVRGLLIRVNDAKGVFFSVPVGYRTSSNYYQGFTQGQQSSTNEAVALIYVKANGDMEIVSTANNTGVWLDGICWYTD